MRTIEQHNYRAVCWRRAIVALVVFWAMIGVLAIRAHGA
jgi:hypothetical protein